MDAVQCYIVDEPIGFAAKTGITPNTMKFSDYGYDAYVQVIFAHNKLLQYHPEIVHTFLEVTFAGWRLALDDVEKAAEIIVSNYAETGGEYDDLDYQIASLKQVANYVTAGITDNDLGKIDGDRWQSMATKFEKYGIINDVPLFSNSVDDRFIN
ncbi:ABC transporter substrate-binding protein [Arthrospira sp. PCC 9108]|nr:ABC transporter substrate-binding protein [Arthrospira sp. PCC 9108]